MVGCVGAARTTGVVDPDLSVFARKRMLIAEAPTAGADIDDIAAVGVQAKRTGGWWVLAVVEGAQRWAIAMVMGGGTGEKTERGATGKSL
jgi:hypothetical protein